MSQEEYQLRIQKKKKKSPPTPKLGERVLAQWNAAAAEQGLKKARVFSKKSERDFKARTAEFGEPWWQSVLFALTKLSDFPRGLQDGSDGRRWRMDLKYALSPAGAEKLLNGGWEPDEKAQPEQRKGRYG